jgi:glycosyltransferase involved in cell wall biosynthesis
LGIEHAVEFIGWVSTTELPRYLSDLDILVNPSLRGWSETFCISNIEGMSMELPLVTFAVGGNEIFFFLFCSICNYIFSFLKALVSIL